MRVNDAIIGLIAIVLSIAVFIHVQSFPLNEGYPGPSLFPMVLSVLLCIAGIVLVVKGLKSKQPWFQRLPQLDLRGCCNILMTIVAILFYINASETLGFLITSFIVMFGMMILLRAKPWIALPVAVGMTLFIYLVFSKGLLVPLPRGLLAF